VIGALGSGLWEIVLRDIFFATGAAVLGAIASVWGGYVDFLHRGIGKLHTDLLVIPIFSFFVAGLLVAPLALIAYLRKRIARIEDRLLRPPSRESIDEQEVRKQIVKVRRMLYWMLTPLVLAFMVLLLIQVWQVQYTRNASTWSERSIEILAPSIGIEEVAKLRAQLRAVETAGDFYAFEGKLRAHSSKHAVRLPKFTSIGAAI